MGLIQGRFPSPLRYPGGKGKIANYLKRVVICNGLQGGNYVEPYAGGAAAALQLLFEDFVDHVQINDLDPGVVAFWQSVLFDTDRIVDLIRNARLTMSEWERQHRIHKEQCGSDVEYGFATFYLNRTNRSGIVTGGPIGGPNQTGEWGIDARFNREDLIRRVQKIARFRERITMTGLDAIDVIEDWASMKGGRVLLYADPPYFSRGGDLYLHHYALEDHIRVADALRALRIPWIVSYDNVEAVRKLYIGLPAIEYTLHYSAAARYQGSEVMFTKPGLTLPQVDSPANLPLPGMVTGRK